jgi:hypothetical protein
MANATFKILRLASVAICLIVIASFAVFAINQTREGSDHQQEELGVPAANTSGAAANASTSTGSGGSAQGAGKTHEGSVHKALTEASNHLTSPFSGVISSSSEWATRGVKMLLALLVYGFGLGFLARMVRVRL